MNRLTHEEVKRNQDRLLEPVKERGAGTEAGSV